MPGDVQTGVGGVRRNFTLLLGRFLPSEGPPRGVSSYPKRRGGKLHAPRLFSDTRSVLDSWVGPSPSNGHAKPFFSPQPSQNDLEGSRPDTILTNALKLIFLKSHPLTLPKRPTTQPRPTRQLSGVHERACAGGGAERGLLCSPARTSVLCAS